MTDADLPGLAVLLDPDRLSAAVGQRSRVEHLRHKPGVSVVASWIGHGGDRGWIGSYVDPVKIDNALDTAQRRGAQAERVGGPDRSVLVVGDVWSDRPLARSLSHLRGRLGADALVLRHNPHRRIVWRASIAGHRVAVKVADRDRATTITDDLAEAGVPILLSQRVDQVVGATWSPWWGDGDLAATGSAGAAVRAGRALAALHRCPAPVSLRRYRVDGASSSLRRLLPQHLDRIDEIDRRVRARIAGVSPVMPCVLHGDFSADQVLVGDDEVRLIDFDRVARGQPAADLGSFAAVARLGPGRGLTDHLLHGYLEAGGRVDPAAVAAWEAYALWSRVVEPFRRADPDWVRQVELIMDELDRMLS